MRLKTIEKNIHLKTDFGLKVYLVRITINNKHFSKTFPHSEKGLKESREYLAWLKEEKKRITENAELRINKGIIIENNEVSNYEKHFHKICVQRRIYEMHA